MLVKGVRGHPDLWQGGAGHPRRLGALGESELEIGGDVYQLPHQGNLYSVNEAYADTFPPAYSQHFATLRSKGYSSRYIGSLVADFHRTLLKGGIFFYPPTHTYPGGKLRLLYEANPLAFIAEQAGGRATNGTARILDIPPSDIHQRTPLIIGSIADVTAFSC